MSIGFSFFAYQQTHSNQPSAALEHATVFDTFARLIAPERRGGGTGTLAFFGLPGNFSLVILTHTVEVAPLAPEALNGFGMCPVKPNRPSGTGAHCARQMCK